MEQSHNPAKEELVVSKLTIFCGEKSDDNQGIKNRWCDESVYVLTLKLTTLDAMDYNIELCLCLYTVVPIMEQSYDPAKEELVVSRLPTFCGEKHENNQGIN